MLVVVSVRPGNLNRTQLLAHQLNLLVSDCIHVVDMTVRPMISRV
jgi:hypothetical protein